MSRFFFGGKRRARPHSLGASPATGRLAPPGDQCAGVQAALFDAELPLPLTLAGGIDFPSNQVGPAPGPNRIRRPFQGPVRNWGAVDRRGPALFVACARQRRMRAASSVRKGVKKGSVPHKSILNSSIPTERLATAAPAPMRKDRRSTPPHRRFLSQPLRQAWSCQPVLTQTSPTVSRKR